MRLPALAAILLLSLAGCTTQAQKDVSAATDHAAIHATNLLSRATEVISPPPTSATVYESSAVWLPLKAVVTKQADPLEEKTLARQVALHRELDSLPEAASVLSQLTGIAFHVTIDALSDPAGQQLTASAGTASSLPASVTSKFLLRFEGRLSNLLDVVCGRYGVSWRYDRITRQVVIYRVETRTFTVHALPGDTSINTTITSADAASAASPTTRNETTMSGTGMSVWKGIDDSVRAMLSTAGKLVVSQATGTLTVTDTPQVLEQIGKYIEAENVSLSRQVAVNVQVLTVTLKDRDSYGINWGAALNSASAQLGFSLTNVAAATAATVGSAFRLAVPSTATGGAASFAGTEALIRALAEQGKVAVMTNVSQLTLNNQPVPVQVGKETTYLASSTTTLNNGTSSTELTPASVTTGFSLTLLPHILDTENLLLHYAMGISSLDALAPVTAGGTTIYTPDISKRNLLQRVMLRSGETLVLSGFEQNLTASDKQGVGRTDFIALGGGQTATKERSILVILVKPVLTSNP